jgi:4-amino-4-deoxychorismate lyase
MTAGTERVRINGEPASTVSAFDRGFLYGDGLFETIRWVDGDVPLWARHRERLAEGCARLGLPVPDGSLEADIAEVAAGLPDAVIRLTLTRGVGKRGYALPDAVPGTRVVAATPSPTMRAGAYTEGLHLRLCQTRLAVQPALAGLKHLNRLEQVLARAEWNDASIDEGLMFDMEGRVVCATAANIFAVFDGELLTPALDRCGVAGVARAEVLALQTDVHVVALTLDTLLQADELFLSSSVRGILPVRSLPGRDWTPGPVTRQLQAHWLDLGLPPLKSPEFAA